MPSATEKRQVSAFREPLLRATVKAAPREAGARKVANQSGKWQPELLVIDLDPQSRVGLFLLLCVSEAVRDDSICEACVGRRDSQ